ncbi:hypothetical protein H6F42_19180 [Pseudanabaena sp. FACHB-1998]|uniref:hypothetical protein n=1 Tax=Pseudanabaena sp. FACHB-1998 TaxID=2692858 RepID=UPI001681596E|nr:hypothetical protein [Pseudanabaena sp. FACHB-1998]MBD2179049.1 hypothetical protein [Pseudanabaena sp. FACHB-1998]
MKIITKVAIISFLWIFLINRGTLGSIDTALRADMSHAWWTRTEEVAADYKPTIQGDVKAGVIGKDGRRYISWDLGQSILMLPGDWIGAQIHNLFPYESEIKVRHATISYLIFIPLNVSAVIACYWLINLFGFTEKVAGLTSIIVMLCTTILHYAQEHQQVNQILLFTLISYACVLGYTQSFKNHFVLLSGLAASAAFLVRMSSAINSISIFLFLLACLLLQQTSKSNIFKALCFWLVGFLPLGILVGLLNFFRYGNFLDFGQKVAFQQLATDPLWQGIPSLPANYPFTYTPDVGILGVLFSPAKSIFIYDPLLLPCLITAILFWKKFSPYIQCYFVAGIFNLIGHILLTSRYLYWAADDSWGAKYQLTSVHLLIIPMAAFLINKYLTKKNLIAILFQAILLISLTVQIASVSLHYGAEISQSKNIPEELKFNQFRLGQRFTNIICQFNSSFTQDCIHQYQLIPFRSNPKVFLIFWSLLAVLTIFITLWFIIVTAKLPLSISS